MRVFVRSESKSGDGPSAEGVYPPQAYGFRAEAPQFQVAPTPFVKLNVSGLQNAAVSAYQSW
jgi:hypothetical protein